MPSPVFEETGKTRIPGRTAWMLASAHTFQSVSLSMQKRSARRIAAVSSTRRIFAVFAVYFLAYRVIAIVQYNRCCSVQLPASATLFRRTAQTFPKWSTCLKGARTSLYERWSMESRWLVGGFAPRRNRRLGGRGERRKRFLGPLFSGFPRDGLWRLGEGSILAILLSPSITPGLMT
jgi:hypothetical protein